MTKENLNKFELFRRFNKHASSKKNGGNKRKSMRELLEHIKKLKPKEQEEFFKELSEK